MIPLAPQRPGQITSQDLLDDLLNFVRLHFYPTDPIQFTKEKNHLLKWVILWPAAFMKGKGVTVPADRYKKIFTNILLTALKLGNTSNLGFRPAWLRMVVQSHFKHHWEEYYADAKSARSLAEHALLTFGRVHSASQGASSPVPAIDPVSDLARAHNLLVTSSRMKKAAKKTAPKQPINGELTLL